LPDAGRFLKRQQKIELLAPAGNFEKLKIAIHYGADAVYLAGKDFSLRNFSGNFTLAELDMAIRFSHDLGKKVYVACNIYPRNHELDAISSYLDQIGQLGPDAVIVADPGIFMMARRIMPAVPIHVSTQANITHAAGAEFWKDMGAARINTAREITLAEISEIAEKTRIEVECFVHGAMCISYSGRCLLSSFMAKRDGNRGMCCQPCRWQYAVVEELRPGIFMPVLEDDRGTYIFNSRDLCMIAHVPEMIRAGICSLKIEGRMKGINYLATVVKVYREAIDAWYAHPENFKVDAAWLKELRRISHRGYCTGFYFGDPDQTAPNLDNYKSFHDHVFLAEIIEASEDVGVICHIRNKIQKGDAVEILSRKGPASVDTVRGIFDLSGAPLDFTQTGTHVRILLNGQYDVHDIIRSAECVCEAQED
jgi:putative protease